MSVSYLQRPPNDEIASATVSFSGLWSAVSNLGESYSLSSPVSVIPFGWPNGKATS